MGTLDSFDFKIPLQYQGKTIKYNSLEINIPQDAVYLIVNPLEDEEEYQGDSFKQVLTFYDENQNPIFNQDIEGQIITDHLMWNLEKILEKLY